jgi:hypothetical protein
VGKGDPRATAPFFAHSDTELNVSIFSRARASLMARRVSLFGTRSGNGKPFVSLTCAKNKLIASLEVIPIFLNTASAPRLSSGSTRARIVAVLDMLVPSNLLCSM